MTRFSHRRDNLSQAVCRATLAVVVATLVVVGVLSDASIGVAGEQFSCRRAASFGHLPNGWAQQSSVCAQRVSGGSLNTWTGATSWRYRPDPNGPVHQMRADRVFISVILVRPRGFPRASPALFRPLRDHLFRLSHADQIATEEGEPTIPQYRFFRKVGCQYDVDLRIDFGRPHPSQALMWAAQLALDGLVLPPWTSHC